jgi:hypothetical protein
MSKEKTIEELIELVEGMTKKERTLLRYANTIVTSKFVAEWTNKIKDLSDEEIAIAQEENRKQQDEADIETGEYLNKVYPEREV